MTYSICVTGFQRSIQQDLYSLGIVAFVEPYCNFGDLPRITFLCIEDYHLYKLAGKYKDTEVVLWHLPKNNS